MSRSRHRPSRWVHCIVCFDSHPRPLCARKGARRHTRLRREGEDGLAEVCRPVTPPS
jgi:hypothetical protein